MNSYIRLIRVKHWVKNILIFTAFFLSNKEFSYKNFQHLCLAFISFSLLASCVYIFNDILDRDSDKNHPKKKNRPIASGAISIQKAWIYLGIILTSSIILLCLFAQRSVTLLYGVYLLINIFYTFFLKKIKYLDIICLISFYIIRILIGADIDNTQLSPIFMLCCITVFTSLSLNKRFGELLLMGGKVTKRGYNSEDMSTLNNISIISAFITLLLFNLHNILFLKITDYFSVIIINFLGIYLILSFFDPKRSSIDDPVSKILDSKPILLAAFLFAAYYLFLLNR